MNRVCGSGGTQRTHTWCNVAVRFPSAETEYDSFTAESEHDETVNKVQTGMKERRGGCRRHRLAEVSIVTANGKQIKGIVRLGADKSDPHHLPEYCLSHAVSA